MTRPSPHPEVVAAQRTLFARWRDELSGGAKRIGWKVGLDIAEAEELIGEEPLVGYLTTSTLVPDGGTWAAGGSSALRGEVEVAVELQASVHSGEDSETIRQAIAGVGVALELVDVKRPPEGLRGIVVGNVFHRAFVLGPRRDGLDAHARRATLTVGSRDHTADRPARDPVATVRSVARVLEGCGERLLGGDWILTGSLVHVPVAPGDDLAGVVDGLGQVTIHIAPEAQT